MEDVFKLLNKEMKRSEMMFKEQIKNIPEEFRKPLMGYMKEIKEAFEKSDEQQIAKVQEKINIFIKKVSQ